MAVDDEVAVVEALPPDLQQQILDLLKELQRDTGMSVLLITHDLNLVRQAKSRVPSRVLRLKSGAVEMAGAGL